MDILVVTQHFFGSVKNLFAEHGEAKLLEPNYGRISTDLVVFTGGEDVHPKHYGVPGYEDGWFNNERDTWELKVLNDIFSGKIITKKVLGICRGHQLLNVGMGGSLIYDIRSTYGISHTPQHELKWLQDNAFQGIFDTVNSLHHQGLQYVADRYQPTILAREPRTSVVEMILWGDKFLGVQFHPEMMGEIGRKGAAVIAEWVDGKNILNGSARKTSNKKSPFYKMETELPENIVANSRVSINGNWATFNSDEENS